MLYNYMIIHEPWVSRKSELAAYILLYNALCSYLHIVNGFTTLFQFTFGGTIVAMAL